MKDYGYEGERISISGKPLPGHDRADRIREVKKDRLCSCKCHSKLGWTNDDCPFCYFTDGFANLNKRCDEHEDKMRAEIRRRGL